MNKRKKNLSASQLVFRIVMQYIATLAIFFFGSMFLLLLCYTVFSNIIWPNSGSLYTMFRILKFLENIIFTDFFIFLAVYTLLGSFIITVYFIVKCVRYVGEVVSAAQKMSQTPQEPIMLRNELSGVENELNSVRQLSLDNAAAAREAEQRKNDLVVYLAHDLKTPLTSVIGYLTLLRDEPQISQELRARYTDIALDKAQRLEMLVNEFFEITRFNLSRMELETRPVNISMLLGQIISEFEPALSTRGLCCTLEAEPDLKCECDPDKLARVLDNLLRNACHYSFDNSCIQLSAHAENDNLIISVQNSGKTIPPEKLERLFEQFFRLDTSRATQSGGAGLGLAIAKQIVELHKGTIFAESNDNSITLTIILPQAFNKAKTAQ